MKEKFKGSREIKNIVILLREPPHLRKQELKLLEKNLNNGGYSSKDLVLHLSDFYFISHFTTFPKPTIGYECIQNNIKHLTFLFGKN